MLVFSWRYLSPVYRLCLIPGELITVKNIVCPGGYVPNSSNRNLSLPLTQHTLVALSCIHSLLSSFIWYNETHHSYRCRYLIQRNTSFLSVQGTGIYVVTRSVWRGLSTRLLYSQHGPHLGQMVRRPQLGTDKKWKPTIPNKVRKWTLTGNISAHGVSMVEVWVINLKKPYIEDWIELSLYSKYFPLTSTWTVPGVSEGWHL